MTLTIDKKRSIGNASKEVGVQEHVIRFWETQFPNYIKPTIGAGGRRYFFDKDIKTLLFIKDYLYNKGYTIKGLQNLLKNEDIVFEKEDKKEIKKEIIIENKTTDKTDKELKNKLYNFKEDMVNFYNKLKNI